MSYQSVEYRLKSPNWYVHYRGVLDGAGMPKIAAGPFDAQHDADAWIASQEGWERSMDNAARWD